MKDIIFQPVEKWKSEVEIERKFLAKELPPLELIKEYISSTVYLCAGIPEVRVRKYVRGDHEDYLLTVKGDGDLSRKEVETYVAAEVYAGLIDIANKPPIIRHGRVYQLSDGLKLEHFTIDAGEIFGFNYAEIEFKTEEQANAFVAPSYLGEDVTFDSQYKMRNYWLRTRG